MYTATKIAAALIAGLIGTSTMAQAGDFIDKREKRQAQRIYNGIQDGSLDFQEAGKQIKGQARVRRQEQRLRNSGGGLNTKERLYLHNQLNKEAVKLRHRRNN